MELNMLNQEKTKWIFEIRGEDHTFCNLLRDELWKEADVIASGYNIKHPLVGIPKFIVETKKDSPKKALEATAKSIKKDADAFAKAFSKM